MAVAVVAGLTFRDYGLGWDDYSQAQYGDLLVSFYTSGFSDQRAFSFVNLYMYGGGFDMAAALLAKIMPFALFETRRLLGAVVGIIGLVVTWRLGRRVGGPVAGLFALVLLATCPLYYGHIFINSKDAPFAVAMTILLFALLFAIEQYPRPRWAVSAFFGLGLGLSLGSRIMAVIAVLYVILPLALLIFTDARAFGLRRAAGNFGRFMLVLAPGFVLAYVLMAFLWPWSALEPLNPFRAIEYFSHFFEKPWKELYEGALISVPEMPRSYVPMNFLLKMPEVMIALSLTGFAAAIYGSRHETSSYRRAVLLLLAGAAALPILITVVTRPAMYNGIRHFVFVTPALAIMGGLGAAWLLDWLPRVSKPATAAVAVIMLAGFADPLIEMKRLHPYQYTYFNRIAGGISGADDRYMLDYWGLAFKEASQQLRAILAERKDAPPAGQRWRIAVCGPHAPAEIELGPEFLITWDPKSADFAMMLGEFYCAELDAPILVEVEREDIIFARVYDIRGLNVTSLFTIPPVR